MATRKSLCPDCTQVKAECICDERCDFCTNVGEDCTCGADRDPYGHKIFNHQEWLRGVENDRGDHEYRTGSS